MVNFLRACINIIGGFDMTKLFNGLMAAAAVSLFSLAAVAPASAAEPLITVDENGNGVISFAGHPAPLPGVLAPDPGPGGLAAVLTYDLLGPPSLTPGDAFLVDSSGQILDVVRFNDYNTGGVVGYPASLLFYSDNIDGFDSLGDTFGPPGVFYTNVVFIRELGDEINNGAFYHPAVGQPGYVPGFDVAYNLISDGTGAPSVPEPAAWAMMIVGFGLVGVALRRRETTPATATA